MLPSVAAERRVADSERGLHRSRGDIDDVRLAVVRRGVRGGACAVDQDVARPGSRRHRRELRVRALGAEAVEARRAAHVPHAVWRDGNADVPRIERDLVRQRARGMGLALGTATVRSRAIRACGRHDEDSQRRATMELEARADAARERGRREKTTMHGVRTGRAEQACVACAASRSRSPGYPILRTGARRASALGWGAMSHSSSARTTIFAAVGRSFVRESTQQGRAPSRSPRRQCRL